MPVAQRCPRARPRWLSEPALPPHLFIPGKTTPCGPAQCCLLPAHGTLFKELVLGQVCGLALGPGAAGCQELLAGSESLQIPRTS